MADGSTKVVYAGLAGSSLEALAKFAAASVSGSSAMLTEAIHSSADSLNQVLLLIGDRRSRAKPDESHAFGYGGEVYFWAFVVAVMVMIGGGAASIFEGWRQLQRPELIRSPFVGLGVLAVSAVFEGGSFWVGYREYKRVTSTHPIVGDHIGLWRFIKMSKDPGLYESLLEDSAALIGIALATVGLLASAFLGLLWADGAASIAIGILLIANSWVIARATRSLIAGETVARPLLTDLVNTLRSSPQLRSYSELKTLHLGPRAILVALTVDLASECTLSQAADELDQITEQLKAVDSHIAHVYFRLR